MEGKDLLVAVMKLADLWPETAAAMERYNAVTITVRVEEQDSRGYRATRQIQLDPADLAQCHLTVNHKQRGKKPT